MSNSQFQQFQLAIQLIYNRWTALSLAKEMEMSGDFQSTQQSISNLLQITSDYFLEYQNNAVVEDLADNLIAYFEECFNVDLEDNSELQVARSLVELYNQIMVYNNMQGLNELKELSRNYASGHLKSVAEGSETESESESMENGDFMEQENSNAGIRRNMPIIDEEGFTLVTGKKIQDILSQNSSTCNLQSKTLLMKLSKDTTEACLFLPAYDQRQCAEKIHNLSLLITQKSTKSHFKFSSIFKSTPLQQIITDDLLLNSLRNTTDKLPIPNNATAIVNLTNQLWTLSSKTPTDVYIYDCSDCIIDISHINIMAIHIRNVSRCIITGGIASGSLLAHSVKNSLISIGCQQFRIHDSCHLRIFLSIPSNPIIEDCTHLYFGPFSNDNILTNVPNDLNNYANVQDFNWHKKSSSPNWKLIKSEPIVSLDSKQAEMSQDQLKSILLKYLYGF